MKPRTGLGRGLDALIDTSHVESNGSSSISEVELSLIRPNPNQPRTNFDEEALAELAVSIRELGVISPVTLRKNADGTYLIIAGERRYRAAKMAGLSTLPAYIRTAEDEQVMEMALIENIQREDLDAIEIALAYQRLMDDYQLTQERMSERVGKKRTTIANYLRLLKLPAEIQMGVRDKKIDMGHARALLAAKEPLSQLALYKRILAEGLSVRIVEQLAAGETDATEHKGKAESAGRTALNKSLGNVEQELQRILGCEVSVTANQKGKGKVVIPFGNTQQLEALLNTLGRLA